MNGPAPSPSDTSTRTTTQEPTKTNNKRGPTEAQQSKLSVQPNEKDTAASGAQKTAPSAKSATSSSSDASCIPQEDGAAGSSINSSQRFASPEVRTTSSFTAPVSSTTPPKAHDSDSEPDSLPLLGKGFGAAAPAAVQAATSGPSPVHFGFGSSGFVPAPEEGKAK